VYLHWFLSRELKRKTTAAENGKIIIYSVKSVVNKRFPELFELFGNLTDTRKHVKYSVCEIVTGALFMFLLKETSRNAYNNDRCDIVFAKKTIINILNCDCPILILLKRYCVAYAPNNSKH